MDKAKVLETFLEEETQNDRETKKPSRDMDRSGALQKVRFANHHKSRPKYPVGELDKRRIAAC
ncbi:MAG: hypothetical protein JRJ57_10510 [Deltaproteobacteria bacterium]|nr:hypothetical protein [Deltaproteobacteria bacterium]